MNDLVKKAVEILSTPGGVVLVPTETVYGLVCDWEDDLARKRIYELKGRSENIRFCLCCLYCHTKRLFKTGFQYFDGGIPVCFLNVLEKS